MEQQPNVNLQQQQHQLQQETNSNSSLNKTPISKIPIRTANAEKRARQRGEIDYDESDLSPSEIRALK